MRSIHSRQRRKVSLQARIASRATDHFLKCAIIGCDQPTQRASKAGLAVALCRKHLLHRQRHGSPWCPSPAAKALKPYVGAALSLIEAHRDDPLVTAAIAGLDSLMGSAGPVIIAPRLRGLPPDQRARIALARLREANVKPERLLAIAVAVHALIEEAPQVCHRIREWRVVAIAKTAHRLASGYHRVWESTDDNGRVRRTELHAYPRSSGRVLRYLGEMIEKECEWVIDRHLAAVIALKVARSGPHPAIADPRKFAAEADRQSHR